MIDYRRCSAVAKRLIITVCLAAVSASISAQDQLFYQLASQRIFTLQQQLQQPSLDSEASVMAYHYKLQTEPAERDKRHRVYCLLEAAGAHAQMPELVADQTVWKDLALIVGQSHDACVLNAIDRTMTAVGKESLAYSLVQPIADVEVIAVRQKVIEFLVQNNLLRTKKLYS